jgi:hypothetical protein
MDLVIVFVSCTDMTSRFLAIDMLSVSLPLEALSLT